MPVHRATVARTALLPRLVVAALCVVALGAGVALVVAIVSERPAGRPTPVAPVAGEAAVADPGAASLLRTWDAARARAWARADPQTLARLYTPASAAGRRDLAMLARWRGRGLRVEGMRTEVLALDVVDRAPRSLVLEVTDRLVGAVVAASGASTRLPADRPSTRRVTLRRLDGDWKVAAVEAVRLVE